MVAERDFATAVAVREFGGHQIGRIIALVREQPWGKRTAFVITTDHGEVFGEHAVIGHGGELWEPLIKVPLVFH